MSLNIGVLAVGGAGTIIPKDEKDLKIEYLSNEIEKLKLIVSSLVQQKIEEEDKEKQMIEVCLKREEYSKLIKKKFSEIRTEPFMIPYEEFKKISQPYKHLFNNVCYNSTCKNYQGSAFDCSCQYHKESVVYKMLFYDTIYSPYETNGIHRTSISKRTTPIEEAKEMFIKQKEILIFSEDGLKYQTSLVENLKELKEILNS